MSEADFANQMWVLRQLEAMRQQRDTDTERFLLDLIEVGDDVWAMQVGGALAELPRAWQEALETLWNKIQKMLRERGVKTIAAEEAQIVDPGIHRVVETVSQSGPPGSIVEVRRHGYSWKDRVLRPAEVVVVASPGTRDR